jgi:CheY-like chemotaxis protein
MTTKILVIDDDSAVTDLLSLLLRSQGFDVTATNSSTDGLNFVREIQPDLVVLDLMMPEIDG